jgi:hypothetical protein
MNHYFFNGICGLSVKKETRNDRNPEKRRRQTFRLGFDWPISHRHDEGKIIIRHGEIPTSLPYLTALGYADRNFFHGSIEIWHQFDQHWQLICRWQGDANDDFCINRLSACASYNF